MTGLRGIGHVQSGKWTTGPVLSVLLLVSVTSCSIEDSEACGDDQVFAGSEDFAACVCDEAKGYVRDTSKEYGCKKCEEGTTARRGACIDDDAMAMSEDAGMIGADASADSSQEEESPPIATGVGEPCTSNDDCADFDATFCDPTMGICIVERCATGENLCPADTVCCDFSNLLAGLSICADEGRLVNGDCPMGGQLVTP